MLAAPGIEPGPPGWQSTALTTRLSRQLANYTEINSFYIQLALFCKQFAKYCKILQTDCLEAPEIIILVSNDFEAKTTKCLIW